MKHRESTYSWFAETYIANILFWRLGCKPRCKKWGNWNMLTLQIHFGKAKQGRFFLFHTYYIYNIHITDIYTFSYYTLGNWLKLLSTEQTCSHKQRSILSSLKSYCSVILYMWFYSGEATVFVCCHFNIITVMFSSFHGLSLSQWCNTTRPATDSRTNDSHNNFYNYYYHFYAPRL